MVKMSVDELENLRMRVKFPVAPFFGIETARALLDHIDAIEDEKSKMINNVAQLQKVLQQERERKKVALPKKVAEALEEVKSSVPGADTDYFIWSIIRCDIINNRDFAPESYEILNNHANNAPNGVTDLVSAFEYGYTVEPEPTVEDKLRSEWTPVIEKVLHDYNGSASKEITRELLDKMMPLTRKIIKAMEQEQQQ